MTKPGDLEKTAADYKAASEEHATAYFRLEEVRGPILVFDAQTERTPEQIAGIKAAISAEGAANAKFRDAFKAWANARGHDL